MNDTERELTCAELAARVGPRRQGKPTDPLTCRKWMLYGVAGLVLPSTFDGVRRKTTWADYTEWRAELNRRREAARDRRVQAAKSARTGGRAAAAVERLRMMNAI